MKSSDYVDKRNANGLREFLTVVFKRKTMILSVFLAVVATAVLSSLLLPPLYESESSLLVKIGREYLNRPEVGNNAPVMSLNQDEIINSEVQILQNRDLIEKVITNLRMENIYPELLQSTSDKLKPMDLAIDRFQKSLKVEPVRKTNVINVTFRHRDPQVAAKAVNLLVEFFKEKHLQVFSNPKSSSFLETQLLAYDQKLRDSENRLQDFKQKNGVYSLDEQRSLLLTQRSGLDSALKDAQKTISEMQKKRVALKAHMHSISNSPAHYTNTERDKIIVEARSKLLALQLNEQELLKKKYTETSRLVVNARKEIQLVKDFLNEQEADINNKVKTGNLVYQTAEIDLVKADTELNAQKGREMALNRQLAEVDAKIRSLDLFEKNMQKLKREQQINEKNYQSYSEKAEEARISDDMNQLKMANISVIQKATVAAEPVIPKKVLLALGVVLGGIAGLGFAFISESFSPSFSTPEQVEKRLGLPVLVAIAQQGE